MSIDREITAFKFAFNRPQTSNDKQLLANEAYGVGPQLDTSIIFGQKPLVNPPANYYDNDGIAEKIRLHLEFVPGTDTSAGRHTFQAKLPPDYEISSSNPKAGSGFFKSNQVLQFTTGSVQIISNFIGGNAYGANLFDQNGNNIPLLDQRQWIYYPLGGLVYQETPPALGDSPQNPGFLDCWIYIGDTAEELITSGSAISGSISGSLETRVNNQLVLEDTTILNLAGSAVVSASATGPTETTYTLERGLVEEDRKLILLADLGGPFESYDGAYREFGFINNVFVTSSIWYTDNTKSSKIIEKLIDYNQNKSINQVTYIVYEQDGITPKTTVVDSVVNQGPFEISRTRSIL
jgi:hypothetical protein